MNRTLILLICLAVTGCRGKKEEAEGPVVTDDVAPVLLSQIQQTVRGDGLIYPKQQAAIVTRLESRGFVFPLAALRQPPANQTHQRSFLSHGSPPRSYQRLGSPLGVPAITNSIESSGSIESPFGKGTDQVCRD